jgi:hypothetical protein
VFYASEADVVDRILMNLHPEILAQSALLPRPTSYRELRNLVGLIEERMAVLAERKKSRVVTSNHSEQRGGLDSEQRGSREKGQVKPNIKPGEQVVKRWQAPNSKVKCWKCGRSGHMQRDCRKGVPGRTVAVLTSEGRSPGRNRDKRQGKVRQGRTDEKIEGVRTPKERGRPQDSSPLWKIVDFKVGTVQAMVDTGAQFSCIRRDVLKQLICKGLKVRTERCRLSCHVADGSRCEIKEAGMLHCSVGPGSWKFHFKVLEGGPYRVILGLDFLRNAQMVVDVARGEYHFAFHPTERWRFESQTQQGVVSGPEGTQRGVRRKEKGGSSPRIVAGVNKESLADEIVREYPTLFTDRLGTVKGMEYEIELVDPQPVRSAPYPCNPPKAKVLKEFVDDLLRKGVVRPSKSPFASPAFLIGKPEGGHRMVVDYRKVNKKICFDAYPLPTLDQAFQCFAGAKIFSVVDLNSAYSQIPLTARSKRVTAFCTPFGLYEFSKLPMGISVGSQGLSRVVDKLFADLKGKFVFNYLDDLVIYSPSEEAHRGHLREVLDRLRKAGFTLNKEKMTMGVTEIKYLGHCVGPWYQSDSG